MTARKAGRRVKHYVLREPQQLEAMVSPLRHQILRVLSNEGPLSAAEIAERLGRSAESLYYHLTALVEVELVYKAGERVRPRHREALYDAVASEIRTDPKQTGERYIDAMQRSASSLLRVADRQLKAAYKRQRETASERPRTLRIQQYYTRLTPSAARELEQRLEELLAFVQAADSPDGRRVSITVCTAPLDAGDD